MPIRRSPGRPTDPGRIVAMLLILSAGWLFGAPGRIARAENCVEYGDFMHWIDGVGTPGDSREIAVQPPYVYIADGDAGLTVVRADGNGARPVASLPLLAPAWDVAIRGDHAFVATDIRGLAVIDVSDPAVPRVIRYLITGGVARALTLSGDHAYVATSRLAPGGYLTVFDISDPVFTHRVGEVDTPFFANAVAVQDRYAYVTDQLCFEWGCSGGLGVFDVSDPTNPMEIGYGGVAPVNGVVTDGKYAFVVSETAGLFVLDVSVPNLQQFVAALYDYPARDVARVGDLLYLTGEGVVTLDVSDPAHPRVLGEIASPRVGPASGVAAVSDRIFLADGGSVQVVTAPTPQSVAPLGFSPGRGAAMSVVARDGYAFVADGIGLQVFDISMPDDPWPLQDVKTFGDAVDVALEGDWAYLADGVSGLSIVDVSSPILPELVTSVPGGGIASAIALTGDHALLAERGGQEPPALTIFDISNPPGASLVARLELPLDARDVAVDGTRALVATGGFGIQVVDITDPTSPILVGAVPSGSVATAVAARDGIGYVMGASGRLSVIDLTTGTPGTLVRSLDLAGAGTSARIVGNRLFAGIGEGGVVVFEITNPTLPRPIGGFETAGSPGGFSLTNDLLVIADGPSGLQIFPGPCGEIVSTEPATGPAPPMPIGLRANLPNPFSSSTRIPFVLPAAGAVRLTVFDARGRAVRTLVDGETLDAGAHEAIWDGRDDIGRGAGAGIYFYRLESERGTITRKATLIR